MSDQGAQADSSTVCYSLTDVLAGTRCLLPEDHELHDPLGPPEAHIFSPAPPDAEWTCDEHKHAGPTIDHEPAENEVCWGSETDPIDLPCRWVPAGTNGRTNNKEDQA